jgi:glycyl-tRNA synthetase beta chain
MASFLLEIGTEELPASFVGPALESLNRLAGNFFRDHRLSHGMIQTMGTPRRLVLFVDELASRQTSILQEVLGPPKSVAYDDCGQPSQAGKGFAKSQEISVDQLQIRETPKGVYVCAIKRQEGQRTPEVLRNHLSGLLQQLSFPKSMRWNASRIRFARPIRWIVALYGSRPIKFEIAGITSGVRTWGHRFLHTSQLRRTKGEEVKQAASYFTTIKRLGIVGDPHERRKIILTQIEELAGSVKGQIYAGNKEELLEQAVYSVECPQAILGKFDPEYLALPPEVLITAMREHQGYFSLVGKDGGLQPKFVAVTNMKIPKMDLIRVGNERVLAARLKDAQYFFHEDRRQKLVDRVSKLKEVVFHKRLGTVYQKTDRVRELVASIAQMNGRDDLKEACEKAATLAKADLLTGMVGEFPSLQGVMGREYARHDGESQDVYVAIEEHYLPRSPEDAIPQTHTGTFLALADRIDTLTAFFKTGMIPSGSEDPFGLRRMAFGIVRILLERKLMMNLTPLTVCSERLLESQGVEGGSSGSVQEALIDFLMERLKFYGRTVHGLPEDVMDAILAARPSDTCDLDDLFSRMKALQQISSKPEFDPLIIGFKRAHRIVEKEQWTDNRVQSELFEQETEHILHKAVGEARQVISECMEKKEYGEALRALIGLKSPIDEFFVGVMVNAPDQAVRGNRLSLLNTIDQLFLKLADFSLIHSQGVN